MDSSAHTRSVVESARGGISYLLRRQSRDGFWRDYHLKPGMSEAWSTAWVGWSLSHSIRVDRVQAALSRAALALHRCSCRDGWGYNRTTGPDADSTSWAVRFLSVMGYQDRAAATQKLEQYLDPGGKAHTFLEEGAGSWGDAHPDVTPVVGLALLSARGHHKVVERIRIAVLEGRMPGGVWPSFWWATEAYATAWSVEFLARTGGIPADVFCDLQTWLCRHQEGESAFELSHRLLAAISLRELGKTTMIELVDRLLDLSLGADGWPPSSLLLVPTKTDDEAGASAPFADTERLMTTAIANVALIRWLRATRFSQVL